MLPGYLDCLSFQRNQGKGGNSRLYPRSCYLREPSPLTLLKYVENLIFWCANLVFPTLQSRLQSQMRRSRFCHHPLREAAGVTTEGQGLSALFPQDLSLWRCGGQRRQEPPVAGAWRLPLGGLLAEARRAAVPPRGAAGTGRLSRSKRSARERAARARAGWECGGAGTRESLPRCSDTHAKDRVPGGAHCVRMPRRGVRRASSSALESLGPPKSTWRQSGPTASQARGIAGQEVAAGVGAPPTSSGYVLLRRWQS